MANILLCWELGAGLGHAARLKSLALPLMARGHRVAFALRDLVHARSLLAGIDAPVFQAPVFLHRVQGLPPQQASLAEILLSCGWIDPGAVADLAGGWQALLQAARADLAVCDYAPGAVLAAKSLGIPSAGVGTGFQLPPQSQALPPLNDRDPAPLQRLLAAEARVLDGANRILAQAGKAPLAHASALLGGDLPLLCTWPELDPWRRFDAGVRWFGPTIGGAKGAAPEWPAGEGPRVFAYLNRLRPEHADLLAALQAAGCRTLCYCPDVAGGAPAPVPGGGIAWARAPVDLDAALPQCAFVVCHAGEATVSQALLAGRPLLLLPHTAESFLTARRVRELGAGINAGELARPMDWHAVVRSLLGDERYARAADAFAKSHAGFDGARQAIDVADALGALL